MQLLSHYKPPKGSLDEEETHAAGGIRALPSLVMAFVRNGGEVFDGFKISLLMLKTCPTKFPRSVCAPKEQWSV